MNADTPQAAVVIYIRSLGRGGAERIVHQEACALAQLGCPLEVWYQVNGEFVEEIIDLGVVVHQVGPRRLRSHLKRVLRRHRRVTVHTHSPALSGLAIASSFGLRGLRFVHTEHNLFSSYRPLTRLIHRATSRRIDELVAVSEAVLQEAPAARSRRSLMHLDTGGDRLGECLKQDFKAGGDLVVLCAASLTPKKDHSNLFRALEILDDRVDVDVRVTLAGDGPLRSQIAETVSAFNGRSSRISVDLLGLRDDIPELLAQSDAFVLPSTTEGLPLVVIEAMASSTPVVATSVGGVPELVVHGSTGLLAPPGHPEELADALETILVDPLLRAELARRGRRTVEQLGRRDWTAEYAALLSVGSLEIG